MRQFQRLLKIKQRLSDQYKRVRKETEDRYKAEAVAAYKRAFPRKRPKPEQITASPLPEVVKPVFEKYQAIAMRFCNVHIPRDKAVRDAIQKRAEQIKLEPSQTVWTRWYSTNSGNHRSMGWSACRYARQDAQSRVDIAVANGLEAHIRVWTERWEGTGFNGQPTTCSLTHYEVWSPVDELGAEVLALKPDIDLVERVRLCWKRGINPRVSMPFLPHGFEEQHGLDFFGNCVKKRGIA